MRAWWDWFDRVGRRVRGREVILRCSKIALELSNADVNQRRAVIAHIEDQIHSLEQDAITAERLRHKLSASRATIALASVTATLDAMSSRLCDILLAERGRF